MGMEMIPQPAIYHECAVVGLLVKDLHKHVATQGRSKVSKRGLRLKHRILCDRDRGAE